MCVLCVVCGRVLSAETKCSDMEFHIPSAVTGSLQSVLSKTWVQFLSWPNAWSCPPAIAQLHPGCSHCYIRCRTSGQPLSGAIQVPGWSSSRHAAWLWLTRPRGVTDILLDLLSEVCQLWCYDRCIVHDDIPDHDLMTMNGLVYDGTDGHPFHMHILNMLMPRISQHAYT